MPSTTAGPKPTFQKVEDKVYWRPELKKKTVEVVIPLTFKTGLYRRIIAAGDAVIQFALVLDEFALKDGLAALDDLELPDGSKVAQQYFEALAEHMGAGLGE